MNETILIDAFKAAPFLAFAVWMVYQMKTAIDRMMDRNESNAKVIATALDKSTEMIGRVIQYSAHAEAHTARMMDIIQDHTDSKHRSSGG